jgi:hypothetical protein
MELCPNSRQGNIYCRPVKRGNKSREYCNKEYNSFLCGRAGARGMTDIGNFRSCSGIFSRWPGVICFYYHIYHEPGRASASTSNLRKIVTGLCVEERVSAIMLFIVDFSNYS